MKGYTWVVALLLALADAGPSCDDALGAGLCPDAFSLEETGACLVAKKVRLCVQKANKGATTWISHCTGLARAQP